MKHFLVFILLFGSIAGLSQSTGVFQSAEDIGNVKHKGSTTFENGNYTLSGSGANIWFEKDELHFASRTMEGDFLVRTEPEFVGEGVDPHRKVGWMARTSNETGAAMVCLTVHGDGLVAFQYRKKDNTNIEEVKIPMKYAEVLQLERVGRSFVVSVSKKGEPFWSIEIPDFNFSSTLETGIFVCSHNADVVEKAVYRNTKVFAALKP